MENEIQFHIISHTHWDREWYYPFEVYRCRLVELFDILIECFKNEDYKFFLLDGQTCILEDYLQIHPEKEELLKKLVKKGKLRIGPWYSQPDEFLIEVESIIRNLLIGEHISKKFGKKEQVGYLPDAFGHIRQLPQILCKSDIKYFCFWRGLKSENINDRCIFYWESPAGDKVLSFIIMDSYCNGAHLPLDEKDLKARIETIMEAYGKKNSENIILCMNGCDHHLPQKELPAIIDKMKKILNGTVIHSNLEKLFEEIEKKVNLNELPVYKGNIDDQSADILITSCASSRPDIKIENSKTESLYIKKLEPILALAAFFNINFDYNLYMQGWKYICLSHAHDSICSCSVDEVHEDVLSRFRWAKQIADFLIKKVLFSDKKDGFDLLFFSLLDSKIHYCTANLLIPHTVKNFSLLKDGKDLPYVIESEEIIEDPIDFSVPTKTKRKIKVVFPVQKLQKGEVFFISVKYHDKKKPSVKKKVKQKSRSIENDYIKVWIENNEIFIKDKLSENVFKNAFHFVAFGDKGDGYNFIPVKNFSELQHTDIFFLKSAFVEKDELGDSLILKGYLRLPSDFLKKSPRKIISPFYMKLTLYKGESLLRCKLRYFNHSKNYKLSLKFTLDKEYEQCYYGSNGCYEVRKIMPYCYSPFSNKYYKPHYKISDVAAPYWVARDWFGILDKKSPFILILKGIYEVEAYRKSEKTELLMTLGRFINTFSMWNWQNEKGYCKKEIEYEFGILMSRIPSIQHLYDLIGNYLYDMESFMCNNKLSPLRIFKKLDKSILISSIKPFYNEGMVVRLLNYSEEEKILKKSDIFFIENEIFTINLLEKNPKKCPEKIVFRPFEYLTFLIKGGRKA